MNADAPISLFEADPRILAVYLLGSGARNALRPDSDLDFGVLPQPGRSLPAGDLLALAAELTLACQRPADLGLISGRNLIYARQCILTGKRIFCRDVFQADLAISSLLGLAGQLDLERREILNAYSA